MGNPHKGEVTFEAGGATYTMRLSVDALCSLEEITGKSIMVLAEELSDPERMTLSRVRQVMAASLREHHPDLSLQDAGELIIAAGGLTAMVGKIGEAFAAAFPEGQAGSGRGRPQKPGRRNGTGPASTATGAASAATTSRSGEKPRAN